MIYLRAAMTALGAAGLVTKALVAASLMAALLAAYGAWHHAVYSKGYAAAIADVARDDARAIGRASKMRDAFEACAGRSGAWDQTTGRCR